MVSVKYANDLVLTDIARQVRNEEASMQAYLMNGNLDGAFLRALTMQKKLDKIMARLNELKYGT